MSNQDVPPPHTLFLKLIFRPFDSPKLHIANNLPSLLRPTTRRFQTTHPKDKMAITAPMFWYHQSGGQKAHQLPDARSDVKGRTLLRRIRSGYTAISPSRTPEAGSPRPESVAEIEEPVTPEADEATPPQPQPQQQQQGEEEAQDDRPPTPPEYDAGNPPPYAGRPLLPPALPGYTPLPGVLEEPTRDLKEPLAARRRYRDSLRKRLTNTRRLLGGRDGGASSVEGSDAESLYDRDSNRGVVLYRENNRWVGAASVEAQNAADTRLESKRGFKAWVRRTWRGMMEFLEEHPYLFVLAVFVIVVVVLCLLI